MNTSNAKEFERPTRPWPSPLFIGFVLFVLVVCAIGGIMLGIMAVVHH